MKLRELESALMEVAPFESPVAELEQYPTSAHLAARVAHTMDSVYNEVNGKHVCDLGTGTGMLSIAVALMGAAHVTAFDIDTSALELAAASARDMEIDGIDFCQVDITGTNFIADRCGKVFDVVIMNPPFGTKRKGVDMAFLQRAIQISGTAVYSMHKTSTRAYLERKTRSWGATGEVLAELKFNIGHLYKFHRSNSVDVQVDLWRFDVTAVPNDIVFPPIDLPEADIVEPRQHRREKSSKPGARGRSRARGSRGHSITSRKLR